VADDLRCGDAMAERLVDTMVSRGFFTYVEPSSPPEVPGYWRIGKQP
jgi:hypothetical protein